MPTERGMSNPTSLAWFPRSSDARELERVSVEHARALDRNIMHHRAHSARLGALESGHHEQGEKLEAQAEKLEGLTVAVAEVRATQKAHVRIVLVVIPVAVTLLQQVWTWLAR